MNANDQKLVVQITEQSLELIGIAPTPPTKNCACEVCQVKLAVMTLVMINPRMLVEIVAGPANVAEDILEMRRKVQKEAEMLLGMTMDSAILAVSTRA